jgi:hypothetical protein
MSAASRSHLEQALELLGPKLTACLVTPIAGIVQSRLHIDSGEIERGVTFASLLYWFHLFYDDPLSECKLSNVQIGFGTGPPDPSHYLLTFDPLEDDIYLSDQTAINNVLSHLRLEAGRIALDANRNIDTKRYVYD